jgi:hypothetical protein
VQKTLWQAQGSAMKAQWFSTVFGVCRKLEFAAHFFHISPSFGVENMHAFHDARGVDAADAAGR